MRKSVRIAFISIFGALHAALYLFSFGLGLWRNLAIYLAPIEGIILGPGAGFLAALLGSSLPRIAMLDPLFIFGIVAEPLSVLSVAWLSRGNWKPVLAIYAAMLCAYFLHPFGRELPLWTIIDVLVALFIIYPAAKLSNCLLSRNVRRLSIAFVSLAFVCTATDALGRIFLLIPIGLHVIVFPDFNVLETVFIGSAISSYIEDVLVVLVSLFAGVPLLVAASKMGLFPGKNEKKKQSRFKLFSKSDSKSKNGNS
jgi:hypothetical protein